MPSSLREKGGAIVYNHKISKTLCVLAGPVLTPGAAASFGQPGVQGREWLQELLQPPA